MPRAYTSVVLPAPVDRVWSVVRDFDALPTWHPAITASTLVEGTQGQVGAVRRLETGDDGGAVLERLAGLDDEARRLTYTILESPFAVRRYVATIRVAPVTGSRSETGETFVEWWAEYDADAADEPALTKLFAVGIFATGLKGLQAHLGG